jgi:hypothetical protein
MAGHGQFRCDIEMPLLGGRRLDARRRQRPLQARDIVRKVIKIGVHVPMESHFRALVAPQMRDGPSFLAGRLWPPGLLGVTPIDPLQEAGGLRGREGNHSFRRRRPDGGLLIQPLCINKPKPSCQRHLISDLAWPQKMKTSPTNESR